MIDILQLPAIRGEWIADGLYGKQWGQTELCNDNPGKERIVAWTSLVLVELERRGQIWDVYWR